MKNSQSHIATLVTLTTLLLTAPLGAREVISGKADSVFVTDSKLVIINDAGKIRPTQIYASFPVLSPSGKFVLYSAKRLVKESRRIKGKTFKITLLKDNGICSLNLKTGIVEKLAQFGENAVFSPNESKILYTRKGRVITLKISNHQNFDYGEGNNPIWINNDSFLFENNFQIYKSIIGEKPLVFFKADGLPLGKFSDNYDSTLYLKRGGKIFTQYSYNVSELGFISFTITTFKFNKNENKIESFSKRIITNLEGKVLTEI